MKRRPRIGVDFHTFDGIFQGSRSHILGLYKEAIRQAPDIDFYFFLSDIDRLAEEHIEFRSTNVKLVRMNYRAGVWRLVFQLAWLQIKHRLDILHTQYRIPLLPLGACACTIHDLLFETHPQYFSRAFVLQSKLTFRYSAWRAKVVFSVSEYSRKEIARLYGLLAEKISVTYNGVDLNRFHSDLGETGLPIEYGLKSKNYVLSIGRLEPRKNHKTLIRAFAQLPEPRMPLVIVGQRDFSYEDIYSEVRTLGLQNEVIFLDDVSDDHLPIILRHASLFVFPAYAEGFGMPIVEAMASGVPVIASNTTSMPEVAGDAALLVEPQSEHDLSTAISRLQGNAELASLLVKRGFDQVRNFNWSNSAESLIQRYRQALDLNYPD